MDVLRVEFDDLSVSFHQWGYCNRVASRSKHVSRKCGNFSRAAELRLPKPKNRHSLLLLISTTAIATLYVSPLQALNLSTSRSPERINGLANSFSALLTCQHIFHLPSPHHLHLWDLDHTSKGSTIRASWRTLAPRTNTDIPPKEPRGTCTPRLEIALLRRSSPNLMALGGSSLALVLDHCYMG
jgi:hypothetical protein